MDWAFAGRAMYPDDPSGDAHVVCAAGDTILVGVLDGRGHGPEAAEASSRMVDLIREAPDLALDALLRRGDEALQGSRGTAVTLARIDRNTLEMTWIAVGNVVGARISRTGEVTRLPLTPGCSLAFHMGEPSAQTVPVAEGDLLVFATDGIERDFVEKVDAAMSPEQIAADVLKRCRKKTDDALVLAARLTTSARPP